MSSLSGLISRRHLFLILVLGLALLAAYGLFRAGWLDSFVVRQPSLLQRLRVPQLSDPWEIDAILDGYRVKLALPQELGKINSLPSHIQDSVRQRIVFRQRNIEVLRTVAERLDRLLDGSRIIHSPEHSQTLERVVMSLPPAHPLLRGRPISPIVLHEPLLEALPNYTRVDFFVPDDSLSQVALRLRELGMEQRVNLYGEQEYELMENGIPLRHHTTRWTRDLFWAGKSKGNQPLLLLPLAFYQINDLARPDNDYVDRLASAQYEVMRVPLFFKSGNLLVGVIDGRRILFIGEDELRLNQDFYYNAFFYFPPQQEVLGLFKQLAGADEVRVLPNSEHLFHLDMVMSVLKPGMVAMIEPVDADALIEDDKHVIAEARRVMMAFGFRIIGVPTFADWVNTFKSPVNILPFSHRDSGRPSAIVPRFEDRMVIEKGQHVPIYQSIRRHYLDAGIEPIFAQSDFYRFGGNFHCAVMPIR